MWKKQKQTPDFLVGQTKARNQILKNLSRAIKEVQLKFANQPFGTQDAGAIKDGMESQHLCCAFEEVLKHGLKTNWLGQTSTFWPVAQKVTHRQSIEYITSLQHAQSDSARCRGWIRMAVNDSSLESYINSICQDSSLLSSHYETYSFLRDPESVSALTQLLTGVASITFKLTVDVASLEFDSVPEAFSDAPLRMKPTPSTSNEASPVMKPKKSTSRKPKDKEKGTLSNASSNLSIPLSIQSMPDDTSLELNCNGELESGGSVGSSPAAGEGVQGDLLDAPLGAGGESEGKAVPPEEVWQGGGGAKEDGGRGVEAWEERSEEGGGEGGVWDGGGGEGEMWEYRSDEEGGVWRGGGKGGEEAGSEHAWGGRSVSASEGGSDVECEEETRNDERTGQNFVEEYEEPNYLLDHLTDQLTHHVIDNHSADHLSGHMTDHVTGHVTAGRHMSLEEEFSGLQVGFNRSEDRLQDMVEDYRDTQANQDNQLHSDSGDLQDSDVIERQNTLVAEDQSTVLATIANLNPFADDPPTPSPPLSPHNPFTSSTPPTFQGAMATSNPFISEATPTNPFLFDAADVDFQSSNPFHKAPSHTSSHASSHTSLPKNPFDDDVDNADHTHIEPRPIATPPSPHRDLPDSTGSAVPPNLSLPSLPDCPTPLREGSAAVSTSSASPAPSRSHTTDDLESCSGSSIDLSTYLDSSPPGSGHLSPAPTILKSPDENFFAPEASAVELQLAIDRLKVTLNQAENGLLEQDQEELDQMRMKIVALQMKLRQIKDEEEEIDQMNTSLGKDILGHKLFRQPWSVPVGKRRMCEGCGKRIRKTLSSSWYICKMCGFGYHKKCLSIVDRVCSGGGRDQPDPNSARFILEVCPERGLTHQHFRCARCNIAFNSTTIVARLCDYSGLYYCPTCHHNDLAVIPARVVHNWDFTQRKVCCKCCDLLDRLSTKPLLHVRALNLQLYTYVQDLVSIETIRRDLLVMKAYYFMRCDAAKEKKLLRRLDPFPHFKDDARRFSLVDLQAVHKGELLPLLMAIHEDYATHIKRECKECSQRGFKCKLCNSTEVLYPFDRRCRQCPKCRTIFHRNCYSEMTTCPECSRTRQHKNSMKLT